MAAGRLPLARLVETLTSGPCAVVGREAPTLAPTERPAEPLPAAPVIVMSPPAVTEEEV